jgi:hypothetical protein
VAWIVASGIARGPSPRLARKIAPPVCVLWSRERVEQGES